MTKRNHMLTVLAGLALLVGPLVFADNNAEQQAEDVAAQQQAENRALAEVRAEQAALLAQRQAQAQAKAQADAAVEDAAEQDDKNEDDKNEDSEPSAQEIRKKMQDLETELSKMRNEYQQQARAERERKQEEAQESVETITLPDEPTRAQCEAYVKELREVAENIRSFSSNSPIVDKLKAVPLEHLDLLVEEIGNRSKLRYFANYALRDYDRQMLRKRFVQSIEKSDSAIHIIVMNGWSGDIEEAIRKKMETADGSLDQAWFQAAVELQDPELYPKLHEVAINSRYAAQFIDMLETLPDYDLAHTVNACWRRAVDDKISVSESQLAPHAVKLGNVDAFEYLVRQLRYTPSYTSTSSSYTRRRMNVLRYIDYRGSNQEIVNWFEKNKKKLVFDHYRQRFVMRGTSVFDPPGDEGSGDNADAEAQPEAEPQAGDTPAEVPAVVEPPVVRPRQRVVE